MIFSEESYEVTTPGEFWLEALFHLGQQTKDPRWQAKYEEFGAQWRDEDAMRERALGQLMAFADEQGKRLLVVVENLNAILGDQISEDDAWKLRHTLQNEPRVMLLATATSRFDEVGKPTRRCTSCSTSITSARWSRMSAARSGIPSPATLRGRSGAPDPDPHRRQRPACRRSSPPSAPGTRSAVAERLGRLVDEHTEYFKSHLDPCRPPSARSTWRWPISGTPPRPATWPPPHGWR